MSVLRISTAFAKVAVPVIFFPIASHPSIDSITRLMTVWRITGKIIRTATTVTYAHL